MRNKLVVIIGALLLSQCGLNQNPLESYPDAIQNAKPPATKPVVPEAIPSDALRLNAPDVVSFMEGTEGQFDLSGRVLLPNYSGRIEVLNLSDFKGATFDQATGIFKWTPSKGIVVDGYLADRELRVRLVAEAEGQIALVSVKSIKVLIQRLAVKPIIESISTRATQFREGGSYDFEMVIKDPDSQMTTESASRVLILNPPNTFPKIKSLASYITMLDYRISSDGKSWIYSFRLNLNGEEVTDSSIQAGFDVQVVSRFGVVSEITPYRTKVLTKLGQLVSSAVSETLTVKADSVLKHVFFTWDPKLEARLELVGHLGLPGNAKFSCSSVARGQLRCVLSWVPTEDQVGTTVNFSYTVKGSNMDPLDKETVQSIFSQRILVVKADEKTPVDGGQEPGDGEGGSDTNKPNLVKNEGILR
jgi:hypothetical protein